MNEGKNPELTGSGDELSSEVMANFVGGAQPEISEIIDPPWGWGEPS